MRRLACALVLLALPGCFDAGSPPTPTPARGELPWHNFLPRQGGFDDATAEPVNFPVTNAVGPANELTIAVNPKDPLNLVAGGKDYHLWSKGRDCPASGDGGRYERNVWSGAYWSTDGGRSWRDQLMPGHPLDGANATHPNRAWPCNSDPVVVFDRDGTAYYSGLGIRGPTTPDATHPCVQRNRSIWLMKSTDQGATWGGFSCVAASTNQGFDPVTDRPLGQIVDKQWFVVDGRFVYFTYMNFNSAGQLDLVFRRSTDGGATWEPEGPVHEYDPAAFDEEGRQYGMPALGADPGELYIVWHKFTDGIYLMRSTDRGETFVDLPRRVAPVRLYPPEDFGPGLYRVGNLPVLAVDTTGHHRGQLYLVWPDWNAQDADVMFSRSSDRGATWSEPSVVHGDAWSSGHQFLPWVATSPNGDVHVLWLDSHRGNGSKDDPGLLDVYVRTSQDGGASWLPPLRVNAATLETRTCFHQNGKNFIGDYVGLAASDLALHPLWPDGRDGSCRATTATVVR